MAEKRKHSLVKAFAKAVGGLILAASMVYGGWFAVNYAGRGEKLTPGETELVQEVFGDGINPSIMRKHFREEATVSNGVKGSVGMVIPPFSHIDFYGDKTASKDFSKDSEYKFGVFMHEATHVWQGQHCAFPLKEFRVYQYDLTAKSTWSDYGAEQQADIIEDYSKRWLYPANVHIKHTPKDKQLAHVVETQFPQAKITRLRLEKTAAPKAATGKPAGQKNAA